MATAPGLKHNTCERSGHESLGIAVILALKSSIAIIIF